MGQKRRRPSVLLHRLAELTEAALEELNRLEPDAVVSALNRRNLLTCDEVQSIAELGDRTVPTALRRVAIASAAERLGQAIPPSLVALWQHEAIYTAFVRGFLRRKLIVPEQLLTPPRWAQGAKLTAVVPRSKGEGYSDLREVFDQQYAGWYEDTKPQSQLSSRTDLSRAKVGSLVRIDPMLAHLHIPLAGWHSESHFVVAGLPGNDGEVPVYSHHDDDEGLCELEGATCIEWYQREIQSSMQPLRELPAESVG